MSQTPQNNFQKLWNIRFIRFLVVGGINTVFGYSVYALFIYLKLHYSLAALFATILGIIFNFKTTGKIVFGSGNNSLLLKFVGVYGIIYLVNVGFLKIFAVFDANMYLAGAVMILPMALVAFWMNKRYVFGVLNQNKSNHYE